MLKLWEVRCTVNEPGDLDLFVWSMTAADAFARWRKYYDLDGHGGTAETYEATARIIADVAPAEAAAVVWDDLADVVRLSDDLADCSGYPVPDGDSDGEHSFNANGVCMACHVKDKRG